MIDLHTHVLPGIDDGATSLAEAVEMCRMAAADGCDVLVATPHQRHPRWWNGPEAVLPERCAALQRALGPRPRLLPGAEVRVDVRLLEDLEHRPAEAVQPIAGGHWLLIEFAREEALVTDPEEIVHELVVAGWRPLLAHPELLPWLAEDLPRLAGLVALGSRLQITAMSLTGEFGRRPREAAEQLVESRLAHVVASDCHGATRRPPGLGRAREMLAKGWGEAVAHRLTAENPRRVVCDLGIES